MSNTTLTNDERRCLQMWFRQAIVEVERREALQNITAFYADGEKARQGHHAPVGRRTTRQTHSTHAKELV